MKSLDNCFRALLAATLLLSGCVSMGNKTHDPQLLDNKVLLLRVRGALQRAGPEFKNVAVSVDGGTVRLTGTVANRDARRRADEIVAAVYEVKHVHDDLQEARAAR